MRAQLLHLSGPLRGRTITHAGQHAWWSLPGIIEGLAESRAITPIITQGSLSEILDKQLVYDAGTTRGGSGGPLFAMNGTIIGVNYAILPEFTGSNFGVPIRFARELVDR